jgi:GAF domain
MDHYSILDQGTAQAAPEIAPGTAMAESSLPLANVEHDPLRFPGDDGGRSLSAMAKRDLDAALQLLAERAQYITGASGAAIALREGEAMICRASAGPSAPELGAALQVNSGLSGESVRTQKILRCDDAESDTRVNRESCRMLGIASVVVMPLVRDSEVNGVFELLSGRAYAFEERDLTALERLGEMIQTAVEHAEAAKRAEAELASETKPAVSLASVTKLETESTDEVEIETEPGPLQVQSAAAPDATLEKSGPHTAEGSSQETTPESSQLKPEAPIAAVAETKPVVADAQSSDAHKSETQKMEVTESQSLPVVPAPEAQPQETIPSESKSAATQESEAAVLNEHGNVKACEACGFPVSEGRKLCLDCEASQAQGSSPEFLAQLSRSDQSWLRSHLYLIGTLLVAALTVAVLVWSR